MFDIRQRLLFPNPWGFPIPGSEAVTALQERYAFCDAYRDFLFTQNGLDAHSIGKVRHGTQLLDYVEPRAVPEEGPETHPKLDLAGLYGIVDGRNRLGLDIHKLNHYLTPYFFPIGVDFSGNEYVQVLHGRFRGWIGSLDHDMYASRCTLEALVQGMELPDFTRADTNTQTDLLVDPDRGLLWLHADSFTNFLHDCLIVDADGCHVESMARVDAFLEEEKRREQMETAQLIDRKGLEATLWEAIQYDSVPVTKLHAAQSPDPQMIGDMTFRSFIDGAVFQGATKIVRWYWQEHPDVENWAIFPENNTNLFHRVDENNPAEMIQLLSAMGLDINAASARDRITPLLHVVGDRRNTIEALLKAGADASLMSRTGLIPLHRALTRNMVNARVLKLFLKQGADACKADADGNTPLHLVRNLEIGRRGEEAELVQILLAHDAQLETRNAKGRTPLLSAFDAWESKVAIALIDAGANVAARDNGGNTALHLAALTRYFSFEHIERLLRHPDAEVNALNGAGLTALALYESDKHCNYCEELSALLRQFGAR